MFLNTRHALNTGTSDGDTLKIIVSELDLAARAYAYVGSGKNGVTYTIPESIKRIITERERLSIEVRDQRRKNELLVKKLQRAAIDADTQLMSFEEFMRQLTIFLRRTWRRSSE